MRLREGGVVGTVAACGLTKLGDVDVGVDVEPDADPAVDTDGVAKLRINGRGSGPAVKVKMLAPAEARLASGRKS